MSNTKKSDSGAAEGARRATEQSRNRGRSLAPAAGRRNAKRRLCWSCCVAPIWSPRRASTA
jgi:hypothetical protein